MQEQQNQAQDLEQQAESKILPYDRAANPRAANAAEAERKRQHQALELQRERILSERTSSPHRRSALTLALADIEERLAEFGRSIHL